LSVLWIQLKVVGRDGFEPSTKRLKAIVINKIYQ